MSSIALMVVVTSLTIALAVQGDPSAALRHARAVQGDFELRRTARLPLVPVRSWNQCDERIGRFCYWHEALPMDSQPEPAPILEARARLIRVLDSAVDRAPDDEWLVGQRVRYLLEAGRSVEALEAARACRTPRWWCEALEGLVRHSNDDFPGADSAFWSALRDMPADERCRWTDLSALLDEPLRRRYRRLDCGERSRFEARLWWLAQPLLSSAGNDRRTEHFARLTMARLLHRARSPYGAVGGADLTELIVRYGWPVAWAQGVSSASVTAERVVVGHEREPAYHFLPDAMVFDDPAAERGAAPPPRTASPRERYAPAYLATFTTFAPEFAAFRRGDSTVVVSVFDLTRDTAFREVALDAALVLARDEGSLVVARRIGVGAAGVLAAAAPWRPGVVSLEIMGRERRRAARARGGLRSAAQREGLVTLSDLLLFEVSDSLPTDLPGALPRARSATVPRGSRVGLYWEVYGLAAPGELLSTWVSVIPEQIGWLRRAAESLHLAARARFVRLEWNEVDTPRDGIAPRALVVDLSTLSPGQYRIEVAVGRRDHDPAVATRAIRVVAP